MIKNLSLYRIAAGVLDTPAIFEEAMRAFEFKPCGPTTEISAGWVPPRGEEHAELLVAVGGHWMLKLMIEQRMLPGAVVRRKVDAMAKKIEQETGRAPGKKHRRELADEARLELLPQAFTKQTAVLVWIDPAACTIGVDATSASKTDIAASALIACAPLMNVFPLQPVLSPEGAMTAWLVEAEAPSMFTIDRDVELRQQGEEGSTVRYSHHNLDTDGVRQHIADGKVAAEMALTFNDRVSFVLTKTMQVKRIEILDVVFDGATASEGVDGFEADVAITTMELCKLVAELLGALGGEAELPIEAAATAAADNADGTDPAYADAVQVVKDHGKASISLVQRHLQIGYNRAARLLERMEAAGLISAMNTSGSRTLLAA